MKKRKFFTKNFVAYIAPVIILLSHLFTMVSLYPGIAYYDIGTQIEQYVTGNFNTNHPLLHTLFIGFMVTHFEGNTGFAIATFIQIIIVDSAICYMLLYLYRKTRLLWTHIIFVCFFSFIPMSSFLTISHTKDIMFSAFALIFVVDILSWKKRELCLSKKLLLIFRIRFVVNIILMILFRNNALYAYIAMLVILVGITLISKSKPINFDLLLTLTLALILSIFVNKTLISITNANNGSVKEMMSIPCQIAANIYNTDATDKEKEIIQKYIPTPDDYQYYLSDHIKMQLNFDTIDSECKHFLLDCTLIALKHPLRSCEAIWLNVQGFFDPVHCPYSSEHFYLVPLEYRGGAILSPKWQPLYDLYREYFFTSEKLAHTPFIIFLNMGIYVWLCIFSFFVTLKRKASDNWLAYLFPLLYLATLLLGPGAIIRYGFLYILLLPVSLDNLVDKPIKKENSL